MNNKNLSNNFNEEDLKDCSKEIDYDSLVLKDVNKENNLNNFNDAGSNVLKENVFKDVQNITENVEEENIFDTEETVEEENICAICLEQLDEFSTIVYPECCSKHFFHNHCMNSLIFQSSSTRCPLDRQSFNSYSYYNVLDNNDLLKTLVYWYMGEDLKIFLFNHFLNDKYIGTNVHSFEWRPKYQTNVDVSILGQDVRSFTMNNEKESQDLSSENSEDGWRITLKKDYHKEICDFSVNVFWDDDIRHLTMTFYTNEDWDVLESLMEDIRL